MVILYTIEYLYVDITGKIMVHLTIYKWERNYPLMHVLCVSCALVDFSLVWQQYISIIILYKGNIGLFASLHCVGFETYKPISYSTVWKLRYLRVT